jgi:hypothetical protein
MEPARYPELLATTYLAIRCRSSPLKMEAAGSAEMLVSTYQTTAPCHNPEDHSAVYQNKFESN